MLCNIPEEQRYHLHCGECLKLQKYFNMQTTLDLSTLTFDSLMVFKQHLKAIIKEMDHFRLSALG